MNTKVRTLIEDLESAISKLLVLPETEYLTAYNLYLDVFNRYSLLNKEDFKTSTLYEDYFNMLGGSIQSLKLNLELLEKGSSLMTDNHYFQLVLDLNEMVAHLTRSC